MAGAARHNRGKLGPHTGDARWIAVMVRDPAADGSFVYGVRTTGVYCRPSCGARRPNRGNVVFHRSPADAERAGFRPCRRCRPHAPPSGGARTARIAAICRLLESSAELPRLATLARRAALSPYHFHRVFRKATGVTPRHYFAAHRAARIRRELRNGSKTVTDAIYDAGFNSATPFYASAGRLLGMSPTEYRRGGEHAEIRFAVRACSLGLILIAQTAKGVCSIQMGDDRDALVRELHDRFPKASLLGADRSFERTVAAVIAFVESPGHNLDLPLDVRGTAFQQRVWQELSRIPPGSTATYAGIAARVGAPGCARAVGQACAANMVALAIPCHRVVSTDGTLSGYRWGIERKRTLLQRERTHT